MLLIMFFPWCVLFLIGSSGAEEWYVSHNGRGFPCGSSKDAACRDLTSAIDQAHDADIIHVDGSAEGYNETLYSWCKRSEDQILDKSVVVLGYNGQPRIGCAENATLDTIVHIQSSMPTTCRVVLQNLQLESGVLVVSNCLLQVVSTIAIDVSIRSETPCDSVAISIDQSTWFGRLNSDVPSSQHYTPPTEISCNVTSINITESHFFQTLFTIQSDQDMSAYVADAVFSNTEEGPDRLGGLQLNFKTPEADILIKDTLFEQQLSPTRIDSMMKLYSTALKIRSLSRIRDIQLINATVVLDNVRFENNERGLMIFGPFQRVELANCLFAGNTVKHMGGAVYMAMNEDTPVKMNNCTFVNNSAGKIRHNYRGEDPLGSVTYEGNVVHVNSSQVKGRAAMDGKGGAIFLVRGRFILSNSSFINNTASIYGGSIFIHHSARIILNNISFESSPTGDYSNAGDVFYSNGYCTVNDVKITSRKARYGLSVFYHNGDYWSMKVGNLYIQCPTGFSLRTENSTAIGSLPSGLKQAHDLDKLLYFCDPCSQNKYSLDFGYLNYTLSCNQFAHYIMVSHHEMPDPDHTEVYNHHRIQCMDCPYGGKCENGISSRHNFWGFKHKNSSIIFRQCPNNYCCSPKKCLTYNSCASNRHGRLCGRCDEGYSDAIFSTGCVPDTACSSAWFWPVILLISVLFCLFLLFVPELKAFVFAGPGWTFLNIRNMIRESYFRNNTVVISELEEHLGNGNTRGKDTDERHTEILKKSPQTAYIIILFFYVQDAYLLHDGSQDDPQTQSILQSVVSALFTFQLNFPFAKEVCIAVGMTPVMKVLIQVSVPLIVLGIFASVYSIVKVKLVLSGSYASNGDAKLKKFCSLLVSGLILAVLVFFQLVAINTLKMLKCISVETDNVLFVDGTITCFQSWQYGVLAYVLMCVIPLCMVFGLGPPLITKGTFPLWQFALGCIFPLPMLIWWLIRNVLPKGRLSNAWIQRNEETKAVLDNLQGPFKDSANIHWIGILLGSRLVLVLFSVFINDVLIKMLCLLVLCILLLLVHALVKPYKSNWSNFIGIVAAFSLAILAGINVVQAGFLAVDYIPPGPLASFMQVLHQIETVFLVWTPCIILLAIFLVLFVHSSVVIVKKLCVFLHRRIN